MLLTALIAMLLSPLAGRVEANSAEQARRPIALVLADDQATLFVVNRRAGTLSVIDTEAGEVVDEVAVGQRLSGLSAVGSDWLLTCDEAAHELVLLRVDDRDVRVHQRLTINQYPVEVSVTVDQRQCVVASLWSRRLTFVELPAKDDLLAQVSHTLDLAFAPRCLTLVDNDRHLIVGDSFSGQLGIVDMSERQVLHQRTLPGHNIRGLRTDPNGTMLLVAQQMLNELAHTVRNDVHWGLLMSNDLRWLRLDAVLSPDADLYDKAHMHPLGHAGSGTGDPSGIAVAPDGTVLVALGGVGEIAVGQEDDFSLYRIKVGRRPTAIVVQKDSSRAYVANTFSDSISVVDLEEREVEQEISVGESAPLTLAGRGELLFFDAGLSHDSWMSCHSCHSDGHANGLMNDNFSDASFGAPKRVLSLLGAEQTAPYAWNANAANLEEQIRKSIANTMQSDEPPADADIAALAAFVRTLQPPPALDRARDTLDPAAAMRGGELFASVQCDDCHAAPHYTTPELYDVGLDDKLGNTEFNPPSLRGVSQRGPYFHDNRARTLEEVFRKFEHQLDEPLRPAQLADLLAFLRSL